MKRSNKIGISFSGGVARGIGHIGAIKAFEEMGVEFDVLSGTSAGSVVAVFYAAGFSADDMLHIIKGNSVFNILRPSLNLSGLGDLTFVKKMVRKHIAYENLEQLPKPVYIAATNITDGICEYIDKGKTELAVMASCSIPLLLKPTKFNDKIYVDGGLMDNLPIAPLENKCDKIIGINVNPHKFISNPKNVLSISQRIFDLMVWRNVIEHTDSCDLLIDLTDVSDKFNIYDYHKAEKMVEVAYNQTMKNKSKILDLVKA